MKYIQATSRLVIWLLLLFANGSTFASDAATVYLTAKGTDLRLAKAEELTWTAMPLASS